MSKKHIPGFDSIWMVLEIELRKYYPNLHGHATSLFYAFGGNKIAAKRAEKFLKILRTEKGE